MVSLALVLFNSLCTGNDNLYLPTLSIRDSRRASPIILYYFPASAMNSVKRGEPRLIYKAGWPRARGDSISTKNYGMEWNGSRVLHTPATGTRIHTPVIYALATHIRITRTPDDSPNTHLVSFFFLMCSLLLMGRMTEREGQRQGEIRRKEGPGKGEVIEKRGQSVKSLGTLAGWRRTNGRKSGRVSTG